MAIETFTWEPDDSASAEGELGVHESKFGDGYSQVSGDGLNGEKQTWNLTFGGHQEEVAPILDFVRRHRGYRGFLWTAPGGQLGLYRCASYRRTCHPGALESLSLTFKQTYHP
ncbi:Phage minor tail protein [compost metagenome]